MCCCNCNKEKTKIVVSYDFQVVTNNVTLEHRNATSMYFMNKSTDSVFVNQMELISRSRIFFFKNEVDEEINTNMQVVFDPASEESQRRLYVIYEWKKRVPVSTECVSEPMPKFPKK